MNLHETIDALLADAAPLEADIAIANRVAECYRTLSAYREATFPLLVDEIRRVRREADRAVQGRMYAEMLRARGDGCAVHPGADRARYLAIRILTPGRPPVTFADATIEDHQAHIDYLNKFRDGLGETIAVHQDAIRQIRDGGVFCLAELEMAAVA